MFPWIALLHWKADISHKAEFRVYLWTQSIPAEPILLVAPPKWHRGHWIKTERYVGIGDEMMNGFRSQSPRIRVTWLGMGILLWMTSKGWVLKTELMFIRDINSAMTNLVSECIKDSLQFRVFIQPGVYYLLRF